MESFVCIICDADLPEGRRLTCSPDCYRLFTYYKHNRLLGELDFIKDRAKERRRRITAHAMWSNGRGKYHHTCDVCGVEFRAPTKRTYWCDATCKAIIDSRSTGRQHGLSNPRQLQHCIDMRKR